MHLFDKYAAFHNKAQLWHVNMFILVSSLVSFLLKKEYKKAKAKLFLVSRGYSSHYDKKLLLLKTLGKIFNLS